jgi:hypothetical protein
MPASIYSLAPAKFNSTVVPVKSISISPSIISEQDVHSGNPYPTLIRVSGSAPKATLTMPFAPAFAVLGFNVTKLTIFECWLAKFLDFVRDGGSSHQKFALTGGSVAAAMITGISVDQDGDLMATVDVVPISDGSFSNPLAMTTGALPTLASQPLLYTLGPCSINGTVIPGMSSAGVDLAQQLVQQRSDGSRYTMAAARIGATPRAFGEHSDPGAIVAALSLDGAHATSTFVQYFRSYDATTGIVSNAASSGCSLTMSAARAHPTDISVAHGAVAKIGVEFFPLSSTSAHPIVVSTSATVPTVS